MKKSVRIAIIIALVVCAGLLITAIAIFSGGTEGGNSNCRYPYKWNTKADNTVIFSIAAPKTKGIEWVLDNTEASGALEITVLESQSQELELSIKPLASGMYSFTLSCRDSEAQPDMILNAKVLVESDLSVSAIRISEQDYGELARGEADNCQYLLYPAEDDGIEVRLTYLNDGNYSWRVDDGSSEELEVSFVYTDNLKTTSIVIKNKSRTGSLQDINTEQTQSTSSQGENASSVAQKEPKKNIVTAKLYGKDALKKQDLKLTISYELKSGIVTVIESHTIKSVAHITEAEIFAQEKEQAEKIIGMPIKIIKDCVNFDYKLDGNAQEKNQKICAYFEFDNLNYEYLLSKEIGVEELLTSYLKNWEVGKGANLAKAPYTAYTSEEILALTWSENGGTCLLLSENATGLEKMQKVADLLQE